MYTAVQNTHIHLHKEMNTQTDCASVMYLIEQLHVLNYIIVHYNYLTYIRTLYVVIAKPMNILFLVTHTYMYHNAYSIT